MTGLKRQCVNLYAGWRYNLVRTMALVFRRRFGDIGRLKNKMSGA